MTRSPIIGTLLPLIPLALLGWPLAAVISQEPAQQRAPAESFESAPLRAADLTIKSAHPFTTVKVTIGDASWNFAPDDDLKEVHFPFTEGQREVTLLVEIDWVEGSPESALFIELQPAGLDNRGHTIWGEGEAIEEVSFSWNAT